MNLIYQYWDGICRESVHAGSEAMKKYAAKIGAAYIFENNPRYAASKGIRGYSVHYGAFKPVMEKEFDKYNKILFADTDVFPIDGLT